MLWHVKPSFAITLALYVSAVILTLYRTHYFRMLISVKNITHYPVPDFAVLERRSFVSKLFLSES